VTHELLRGLKRSESWLSALGDGAGEGNRTLVFSLEVVESRNALNPYSDILQPCG
jgi:hypothetical protein